jgi:hypothetical protein
LGRLSASSSSDDRIQQKFDGILRQAIVGFGVGLLRICSIGVLEAKENSPTIVIGSHLCVTKGKQNQQCARHHGSISSDLLSMLFSGPMQFVKLRLWSSPAFTTQKLAALIVVCSEAQEIDVFP